MRTERAEGVVLRHRPLTETSLIVQWLTLDQGRISTVARGARRPKSPYRGKLDVCYAAGFTFVPSRRSDLHTLHEVVLQSTFPSLRVDLKRLRVAAYATRLVERATETGSPLPECYLLFRELLEELDAAGVSSLLVQAFEVRLLGMLGLDPAANPTRLPPSTRALITKLAQCSLREADGLEASSEAVQGLDRFLHGFLAYHLGRPPKGRQAAVAVAEKD